MAGLAVTPAEAKKKVKTLPRKPKVVVAVLVITKNNPDPKLTKALKAQLAKPIDSIPDAKLLTGKPLAKAINGNPDAAMAKCRSDLQCIAKLGKKAKAKKVILARIAPGDTGISVGCLVINVDTTEVEHKSSFTIANAKDAKTVLASNFAELLPDMGGNKNAVAAAAPAPAADEPALDLGTIPVGTEPAAAPAAPADASASATPPPADAGGSGAAQAAPGTDASATPPPPADGATPATAATGGPGGDLAPSPVASVAPAQQADTAATLPGGPAPASRLWRYAGGSLAGVGIVALGVGGFFGMQSSSNFNAIKTGPTGTNQVDAKAKLDSANSAASTANLLFGVGGAATAVGAGLFLMDMLVFHKSSAAPAVVVDPQGPGVSLWWRF